MTDFMQIDCGAAAGASRNERGTQGAPFTFGVSDMMRLRRFLVLGTEGGKYTAGRGDAPCKEHVAALLRLLAAGEGVNVVTELCTLAKEGRCAKLDPTLFALAVVCRLGDDKARSAAYAAVPTVCGIPTHLFQFIGYLAEAGPEGSGKGWGRGMRRAVSGWYTSRRPRQLAYQCTKFANRNGWTHKDVLRMCHLKAKADGDAGLKTVAEYLVKGWDTVKESESAKVEEEGACADVLSFLRGVEAAKVCEDEVELIALIEQHGLAREHVPTTMLNNVEVWRALLRKMPITAMIRNLGKMSALGLLTDDKDSAETTMVCTKLCDESVLRGGKVHPLSILIALRQYQQGKGDKGSLRWPVVKRVADALDDAFYLAFKAVEPTGKRIVVGLDVSGSMGWEHIPNTGLNCREASAAMVLLAQRTEPSVRTIAFSKGITELRLDPSMKLEQAITAVSGMPFDCTDCAAPMLWAMEHNVEADTDKAMTAKAIKNKWFVKTPSVVLFRNFKLPGASSTSSTEAAEEQDDADYDRDSVLLSELSEMKISDWVTKHSVKIVDELTHHNFKYYEDLKLPMLMLFVNKTGDDDASIEATANALGAFQGAAPEFRGRVSFVFCDDAKFNSQKLSLGLPADVLPSMAFNTRDHNLYPYPTKRAFTTRKIKAWVSEYLKGELTPKQKSAAKPHEALGEIVEITANMWNDFVNDDKHDVMLLLYVRSSPQTEILNPHYKRVAERFKWRNVTTLKVGRMDVEVNQVPVDIDLQKLPAVVFFPANDKNPPYRMFHGKGRVRPLMLWARDQASIPFYFENDTPDLDAEQRKAYEEQVAERDERIAKKKAEEEETKRLKEQWAKEKEEAGSGEDEDDDEHDAATEKKDEL